PAHVLALPRRDQRIKPMPGGSKAVTHRNTPIAITPGENMGCHQKLRYEIEPDRSSDVPYAIASSPDPPSIARYRSFTVAPSFASAPHVRGTIEPALHVTL